MGTTKPEGRIFLIADTHFGDENIRLYEERPFPDTDTMDREIIRRWNSVVGDNDLVYHLGDFCSGDEVRCRELLSQLKGHKRLIIGNHDTRLTPQQWRELGFEECYDLPILLEKFFVLSHEPLYVCRSMPYANIYGHIHNHPSYKTVSCRSACVSVERIDYTPVPLDLVRSRMLEAEKEEKKG